MKKSQEVLEEMQQLDDIMNKRLALEKKKHKVNSLAKPLASTNKKRTEFSF
tara:strand:- start:1228 stop:1380 length:153 start_codon:yes stop_codon:yes gene_type:complete